jgi:hypothetical protein
MRAVNAHSAMHMQHLTGPMRMDLFYHRKEREKGAE